MKKSYLLLLLLVVFGLKPLNAAQISNDEQKLLNAASSGNVAEVEKLIASKVNLNIADQNGLTALHWATQKGQAKVVRMLIDNGANKDAADNGGNSPLHLAIENNRIEAAKQLLNCEATMDAPNNAGKTPLDIAKDHAIIQLLNNTTLLRAAFSGSVDTIKNLLDSGRCNKDAPLDDDGNTALHWAAAFGNTAAVTLLIGAGANKETKNNAGETPLQKAAREGSNATAKELISQGADVKTLNNAGSTPLHYAAKCGSVEMVKALIAAGANKDTADKDGNTPLHLAAEDGDTAAVTYLIGEGTNKETKNKDGETPLQKAVKKEFNDTTKELISRGADVNTLDNNGNTPLHWAAQNGYVEIVKLLLAAGANKDAAANDGWAPLHIAAYNGQAEAVKALIAAGTNINAQEDKIGNTPLHWAAKKGHTETVETLLAAGANATIKNNINMTALSSVPANNTNKNAIKQALMKAYKDLALKEVEIKEKEYPRDELKRLALFINDNPMAGTDDPVFFAFLCAIHQHASPIIVSRALLALYVKTTDFDKDSFKKTWYVYNHSGAPTEDLFLLIPIVALTPSQAEVPEKKINLSDLGFDAKYLKEVNIEAIPVINDTRLNEQKKCITALMCWLKEESGPWAMYLDGHGMKESCIAGMPRNEFEQVIDFLSKNITTYFLFYQSCYGGGENLITPYLPKTKYSSRFIVAQAATTESVSFSLGGTYDPFFPQTNLKTFFYELNSLWLGHSSGVPTFPSWREAIESINRGSKLMPQNNTVLIRFPGTDFFQVSNTDKKVFTLTTSRTKTGAAEGKIDIPKSSAVILLYPPIVPTKLMAQKETFHSFISMNPEDALHIIEEINSKEPFEDTKKSMLKQFALDGCFKGKKIFIVKQWNFPNSVSYSNIVIWNKSGTGFNGRLDYNKTSMAYQQTEHSLAGSITHYFLTGITYTNDDYKPTDDNEQKRLDEIKQENIQPPLPLDEKEWHEKAITILNDYAQYKPKLVNINGELVAPWQTEPNILATYAKDALGLEPIPADLQEKVDELKTRFWANENVQDSIKASLKQKNIDIKMKEFFDKTINSKRQTKKTIVEKAVAAEGID